MSNTKHTPVPWRLNENKTMVVTDAMPPYTYGENGQYQSPYIVCQPLLYVTAPLNEARANARLIVCAVNNHYDLLTLLEKIDSLLAEWKNLDYINYGKMQSRFDEDLERVELEIEEAIVAARGNYVPAMRR